jgi:hypothetical protein
MTVGNTASDYVMNVLQVSSVYDPDPTIATGLWLGYQPSGGSTARPRYFVNYAYDWVWYADVYTFNSYFNAEIVSEYPDTVLLHYPWDVTVNNHFATVDYVEFNTADQLFTGAATETDTAHTYGSSSSLYFFNLSGNMVYQWKGLASGAVTTYTSSMNATWAHQWDWVRDGRGATC